LLELLILGSFSALMLLLTDRKGIQLVEKTCDCVIYTKVFGTLGSDIWIAQLT